MPATQPNWYNQVKEIFDSYGVPEAVWVPIAYSESRGNPGAVNDTRGEETPPGTQPEWSIGLFQINILAQGLNDIDSAALAEKLKDPIFNASYHAPKIAAAWEAIKSIASGEPPQSWAPLVAVRSGHPGGHPNSPCVSAHCNRVRDIVLANAEKFIQGALVLFGGSGAITPAGGGSGHAYPGAQEVSAGAGGVAGAIVGGGAQGVVTALKAPEKLMQAIIDLLEKIQQPDILQRYAIFMLGFIIFSVAALAILVEQTPAPVKRKVAGAIKLASLGL